MESNVLQGAVRPRPVLGWAYLSRKDIQRAERQLSPDTDGVRDEIGFLALHQAYANRLFPGTSVLHTRLRYVLFVPWLFRQLERHPSAESAARRLRDVEVRLTGRLKQGDDDGVIGGRVYPNPSAQQASAAYWSALGAWGLLLPRADGTKPSRAEALRRIDSGRRARAHAHDDDHHALDEVVPIFAGLPEPPQDWIKYEEPLSFKLRPDERRFLRSRLGSVMRLDAPDCLSLLSRLVESRTKLQGIEHPWHESVMAVASEQDLAVLTRAKAAAALTAVGRGIYAALVEEWRERIDKQATPRHHREWLQVLRSIHGPQACELDLDTLRSDDVDLAQDPIIDVLAETQRWLMSSCAPWTLVDLYQEAEHRRKGLRRARLGARGVNRERRLEWDATLHPQAQPLHYRWPQVRRLLLDLQTAR